MVNLSKAGQFVTGIWTYACISDHRQGGRVVAGHTLLQTIQLYLIGQAPSIRYWTKSVKSEIRMVNLQTTKVRLNIVFCNSAIWFYPFVLHLIFNMQLWLVFSFVLLGRERKFHVSKIDTSTMINIYGYHMRKFVKSEATTLHPLKGGKVVVHAPLSSLATPPLSMYLS